MDTEAWIQLGVLVVTLIVAAATVNGKLCAVVAKQENLLRQLESMAKSIRRLFELWDNRPCERHASALGDIIRRIEEHEQKIRDIEKKKHS